MILPANAIGLRAGIGVALTAKKPHIVSEHKDENRFGRIVKYGADEFNPEGFTLGQLYGGISVIQRYSRGYLKKLRRRLLQLHERERAGERKVAAAIRLQRWFRWRKFWRRHQKLVLTLEDGNRRKLSSVLKIGEIESKKQHKGAGHVADGGARNIAASKNESRIVKETKAEADRAAKHAADITVKHAMMKERHARELAHVEHVIGREKAASRLQQYFRRWRHEKHTREVARGMRSQIAKMLAREDSFSQEVDALKQKLAETKSALDEARAASSKKNDLHRVLDISIELVKAGEEGTQSEEQSDQEAAEEDAGEETAAPGKATKNNADEGTAAAEEKDALERQSQNIAPVKPSKRAQGTPERIVSTPSSKASSVRLNGGASKRVEGDGTPSTPRWKNDSHRGTCAGCKKTFTWLRRQHHCRLCGDLYCQDCSAGQRPLPLFLTSRGQEKNLTGQAYRVCDECGEDFDHGNFATGHAAHHHHAAAAAQRRASEEREEHPQVANTDAWRV